MTKFAQNESDDEVPFHGAIPKSLFVRLLHLTPVWRPLWSMICSPPCSQTISPASVSYVKPAALMLLLYQLSGDLVECFAHVKAGLRSVLDGKVGTASRWLRDFDQLTRWVKARSKQSSPDLPSRYAKHGKCTKRFGRSGRALSVAKPVSTLHRGCRKQMGRKASTSTSSPSSLSSPTSLPSW